MIQKVLFPALSGAVAALVLENNYLQSLDTIDRDHLTIHADDVLEKIRTGDESWKTLVPQTVADIICERKLFL